MEVVACGGAYGKQDVGGRGFADMGAVPAPLLRWLMHLPRSSRSEKFSLKTGLGAMSLAFGLTPFPLDVSFFESAGLPIFVSVLDVAAVGLMRFLVLTSTLVVSSKVLLLPERLSPERPEVSAFSWISPRRGCRWLQLEPLSDSWLSDDGASCGSDDSDDKNERKESNSSPSCRECSIVLILSRDGDCCKQHPVHSTLLDIEPVSVLFESMRAFETEQETLLGEDELSMAQII